jgi:WD40-like Beta Propeller Repeat/Divergent InlB B-repeat domain
MPASLVKATRSIALSTLILAPLVFVPLAGAVFPGQNGKLTFHHLTEIWVAGADGSNRTQLSRPGFDRSPSWSPDGTRIAFSSDNRIVVMNADGSEQRQLTFGSARDRTTAWTSDGTRIVFDREFAEIYVVNADGSGGERKVTDGLMPATSPYGDKIAFSAAGGGLFTINLDGSNRRQITEGAADYGAHWSPGGTELVFARVSESDRDLYRVHANGVGLVRLTTTPGRSEVGPVWSPDGARIAFAGCPNPVGSSDCGIYLINRDGSGETQVGGVAASFAENPLDWQALPPFPRTPPAALTVSLVARGGGTGTVTSLPEGVDCPPACSTEFDRGATVRLAARPAGSAVFLGWSGACAGRTLSCNAVMDGDKNVTATFGRMMRLKVSIRGPGRVVSAPAGIACPPRCTAAFVGGTRVALRASPARAATFAGWNGACRGTKGCRISMSANRSVSARFRR